MSTKTERVIEGEEVIIGGVPVSIEMNRGELHIHVGNSPKSAVNVRVTVTSPEGRVTASHNVLTHVRRDLEEASRRYHAGGLARVLGHPLAGEDQTLEDTGPR